VDVLRSYKKNEPVKAGKKNQWTSQPLTKAGTEIAARGDARKNTPSLEEEKDKIPQIGCRISTKKKAKKNRRRSTARAKGSRS